MSGAAIVTRAVNAAPKDEPWELEVITVSSGCIRGTYVTHNGGMGFLELDVLERGKTERSRCYVSLQPVVACFVRVD
ncbi:hypothetical protein FQZ97_630040 [compost metagenome]